MPRYFAPEERYNKFKAWREQRNLDAAGQGPQAPADPVWQSVARNVGTGPAPVLPPAPQPVPMPPPQLSVSGDWMQSSAPAIAPSTPVPSSMTVPSAWLAPYSEPTPLRLPKVPAFSAPPSTPPDGMNWQTADQMATPPTPTIPMPTRPYRNEAVDADLDALAAVPRDLAGAGLGAYNEFIGRPVTGLATELAGGREQEAYERQRGLPERADTGGDLGNWWRALSERQRARAEAGIASVPLGDVLPFTPGEYAGIARGVAPVARGLLGEVGAVAKSAPVAKGLQAVDRLATSPIVGKIAPGLGIEDVSKTAPDSPTFYSQLERAVASPKAPNRAPAEQWRGILNAQGVKSDELRWTGVDDLLSERAGRPVTRQELQAALDQNRVNVQEVTKGGFPTLNWQEHDGGLYDLDHGLTVEPLPNGKYRLYARGMGDAGLFSTADEAKVAAQEIANREVAAHPRTKFGQYQLPGGENYRELLMTLPPAKGDVAKVKAIRDKAYADFDAGLITREERNSIIASADEFVPEQAKYTSSHWDEPNVLAHVRFNDRTASDGKKVLFVEEIQSDWHQAGRQKGYSDPAAAEAVSHEHSALLTQLHERYGTTRLTDLKKYLTPEDEAAIAKLNERYAAVSSGPPAAPFSKTWPELALKRMIRWASENGYDRIAWTTGKQQAERYDLAKQVDSLNWFKKGDGYTLYGRKDGRAVLEYPQEGTVSAAELPNVVGREIADRIVTSKGTQGTLSGLDLSVGGEGMQGFYDRILPETANKLGKKFGARVSTSEVGTGGAKGTEYRSNNFVIRNAQGVEGGQASTREHADRVLAQLQRDYPNERFVIAEIQPRTTVHSFDITPALKTAAMKEGFPLFVPPEIGGAVAGGAYGATQPAESEQERAQNIIKGAAGGALVGSGARAAGKVLASKGAKGPFGERLGLQADADEFAEAVARRQDEIQVRHAEIEAKWQAIDEAATTRSEKRNMPRVINRPSFSGSATNEEVEQIAKERGLNAYADDLEVLLDPESFSGRGPGQRSGKVKTPPSLTKEEQDELKALQAEYKALNDEVKQLNDEMEAGYQAALEKPAAPPAGAALEGAQSSPSTPPLSGRTPPSGGETPLRPSGNPPEAIVPPAEQGGASTLPRNAKTTTPTKKPLPPEIEQPIQQGAQQELQGQGQSGTPPRPPATAAARERAPLWQGKTGAEPPLRSGGPPAPPEGPPPELPSGRTPGGGEGKPLGPEVPGMQRLEDALTPEKRPLRDRIDAATKVVIDKMYNEQARLGPLAKASGVPVDKLAELSDGSSAYAGLIYEQKWKPVFQPIEKAGDIRVLERYMVLRREQDILANNPHARVPVSTGWGDNFRTVDALRKSVGEQRFAAVEAAAKKLYALNDEDILKPLVDNGLMKDEQRVATLAKHPHYVDFRRADFSEVASIERKMGVGDVSGPGLKEMQPQGSSRKLDNPLARNVAQVYRVRQLIEQNKAANAVVEALIAVQKPIAEELGVSLDDLPKSAAKIREMLAAKRGVPLSEVKPEQPIAWLLKKGEEPENSNLTGVVNFMREGDHYQAQVPAEIATVMKGLDHEAADALTAVMRKVASPLRATAVTYNVDFLWRNPLRDMSTAWYQEGLVPLSPDYIKGWISALTKDKAYEDAARSGALMGGIIDSMRSTEALSQALRLGEVRVKSWKDVPANVVNLISAANAKAERATRMGVWHKLEGQPGVGRLEQAIRVRNVNVNFNKAGSVMRLVNQVLPFTNASLHGAVNTLKLMKDNPKAALVRSTPFAMVSVLTYMWNQRYDTADQVPDHYSSWSWPLIIGEWSENPDPKLPNKPAERHPIFIPIPKGPTAALLTVPVEVAMRLGWKTDNRSAAEILLSGLWDVGKGLSPIEPGVGGIVAPGVGTAVEMATNYDLFRNQPIVPASEEKRPPEYQFGTDTSRAAVALGQRFNVSPRLIDFAIRDYFAGVGKQSLWATDIALGALGYDPMAVGEAQKQQPTDVEMLARTPIVGNFVRTAHSQQTNVGWDHFDKAVEDGQRQLWQNDELRRLGIGLGPVGDSITMPNGAKIILEPQERAELQQATALTVKEAAEAAMAYPQYQTAPNAVKIKVLERAMDHAREATRRAYLGLMDPSEVRRRAGESIPVPVGGR